MIGYHSKTLPQSTKNFGVTELELTGLLFNIHGFMQLLCNRYFEVLVDHKTIEYMIKSKTESPTTQLKTLLLKLSRLQNIADMPDNKDIIPLIFYNILHLTILNMHIHI